MKGRVILKKVGFIGFGNMAEAIITGMISSGNYKCEEIGAFDTDKNKLNIGSRTLGITAFESNDKLVNECETVVLAVKPIALQKVLSPIKDLFCKANPLVISIAAGQSIDKIKEYLEYDAKIVRVMPNINAIANCAISGYALSDNVTSDEKEIAVKILNSFGTSVEIKEDLFSAYSAVAGCSPAYVYTFADAIARVGIRYGLTKKESTDLVAEAILEFTDSPELKENEEIKITVLKALDCAYKKDKGM